MDPLSQLSLLATQLLKEEPQITVSSASHAPPQPQPPHIPPPPHQRHTTIRTIHNPCKDHLILVTCKSVCKGISFEHAQRPTFIGYLKTPLDAALLVEAVVSDTLPLVRITETTSHLLLQSGTICVMKKEHGDMMLNGCNKQGSRWSFGIEQGLFTIFREVEPLAKVQERCGIGNKEDEGKPRLVTDGLCKKSISITGSDGIEYLVIGYYYAKHVVHFYTRPPFPVPGAPPPKAPLNSLIIPSETTQFNHLLPRIHPSLNPPRPTDIPLFQAYCPIFRGIENAECTCPPSLKPLRFRYQQAADASVKKMIGNTPDSSPER